LEQKRIDATREPCFVGIEFVDKWFATMRQQLLRE
jgi:hypothetical protein